MRLLASSIALAVACSWSVQASADTFTNPTAFFQALSSSTTADFNNLGDAFYGGPGYGNGIGTLTYNGITVSTPTSYLFSSGGNNYGTGSTVGAQQFSPTVVNLIISQSSTAIGFNYNANLPLILTVGSQTYNLVASGATTLSFFGVTSSTPFTAARLSTTGAGSGIGLDNVTFGLTASAVAVPENTTWMMIIFGMGAVGFAMRRRCDAGHASAGIRLSKLRAATTQR